MHKKLMIISRLVIMAIILLLFYSCAKPFDTTYNNVALKIYSISPTSGQAGATVTITGSNFVADTSKNIVYFNGVKAAVITATTSQIVVLAPISTTGKVSVTANGLTGTGPVFTYLAPAPVITNIDYNGLFIIYGQHFDPTASVVSIDDHIAEWIYLC